MPNWLIRGVLFALSLLLCGWLCLSLDIYNYSFVSDPSPADAAIVLGAAAWGDRPSPVFEERIKHAIDLYKQGRVKAIIFTGGLGQGESLAESIIARSYALEQEVAAKDIFVETTSRMTVENLCEAKKIIRRERFGRVLIVSDPLHMRRAMTLALDLGLDAHSSPTPTSRYISLQSQLVFLADETRVYAGYVLRKPFTNIALACSQTGD